MPRACACALLLLLLAACGGAPPPTSAPFPAADAAPAAPSADAGLPTSPAPLSGERFELREEQEHTTTGGLRVRFAYAGATQRPGGEPRGYVLVDLERGEQKRQLELPGADGSEAEVDAFGTLLVVRVTGAPPRLTVVVAAEPTPAPLDEDAAAAEIDAVARQHGLPGGGAGGCAASDGLQHCWRADVARGPHRWDGYLGLYTRRLWFVVPAAAPAPAASAGPPDAGPPDAGPPPRARIDVPAGHPEVAGPRFTLKVGKSHTTGGITVTWSGVGHKIGSGGSTAMYAFEVKRGKRSNELEIHADEDTFEAEVDAFGTLLVFTGDYDDVTVIVAAKKTPKPLDEDAAQALVEETAAKHGLPEVDGASMHLEHGILRYWQLEDGRPIWGARVGVYTRRVWFVAAP